MNESILYKDKLIEITDNYLLLKQYYFPSLKPKTICLKDIENIKVLPPTLANGKWRLQGSGNFRIWFSLDIDRPKRDKIFLVTLKNKWIKSAFTAEDSEAVLKILESPGRVFILQ
jgi:hypothetical protein